MADVFLREFVPILYPRMFTNNMVKYFKNNQFFFFQLIHTQTEMSRKTAELMEKSKVICNLLLLSFLH